MDFRYFPPENFAFARDFLYLAALFFGAGIGCILNKFKKKKTDRYREISLTVGFLFFSGTIIALTIAVIYSNWMVFYEISFYLPIVIIILLLILIFRFPRAIGFPAFIASGIFMVWITYSCLRFPVINGGRVNSASIDASADYSGWCQAVLDGSGSVHIRIFSSSMAEPDIILPGGPDKNDSFWEFKAVEITIRKDFPLIGGKNRVILAEITEISQIDHKILYTDPRLNLNSFPNSFFRSGSRAGEESQRFISFYEALGRLEPNKLVSGIGQIVKFN